MPDFTSVTENEEPVLSRFRWILVMLDILYLGLMALQKSGGKFPSTRFETLHRTILVHVCCGIIIIYSGCFLHIQNESSPITRYQDDNSTIRLSFYYFVGIVTIIHSITVLQMSSKVMGERRLTLPLYIFTGTINLLHAINLMIHPTLENAFLLWGSVNTFVLVRVNIICLLFSNIDWELAYTYSITAAAGIIGPLTNQPYYVYLGYFIALLYAPFHERISDIFGWDTEDTLGGNQPSHKNIIDQTKTLRSQLHLSVRDGGAYGSIQKEEEDETIFSSSRGGFNYNYGDDNDDMSQVSEIFSVIHSYAERV